jgi:hypothetical protein
MDAETPKKAYKEAKEEINMYFSKSSAVEYK